MANDQALSNTPQNNSFYVQDIEFASGICPLQMPGIISLAAAMGGYLPPAINEKFTYADLGCGNGATLAALASIYPAAEFIGVDFNAGHIATGRTIAEKYDLTNLRFIETSFDKLDPADIPSCDFATMRGCYAWLETSMAQTARHILGQIMKPGGLVMIEFMCLPGKITVEPLWKLIQTLVPQDQYDNSYDRAKDGMSLLEMLARRGMKYLNAHGTVAQSIQKYMNVTAENREIMTNHFSHNAMASGFNPRYFTDMHDEMKEAGFSYAGDARLTHNDLELCVPQQQIATIKEIGNDLCRRETLKDFIRNEQNRNGVFVFNGQPDRKAANKFLDDNLRIMRAAPEMPHQYWIGNGFGHKVPLKDKIYDSIVEETTSRAITPAEFAEKYNADIDEVRQKFLRSFASGQFILYAQDTEAFADDIKQIKKLEMNSPFNMNNLDMARQTLTICQLVSETASANTIALTPLESLLLYNALTQNDGLETAVKATRAALLEVTQKIPTKTGPKSAKKITPDEIQGALDDFKTSKLPALLTMKIVSTAE